MLNHLLDIEKFGQKIWLDNLSRKLIYTGELSKLIKIDKISGVTSNPAIFFNAISTDPSYEKDLIKAKTNIHDLESRYESLIIPDIKYACDLFFPLYNYSNMNDGYVSLEVSPHLANDEIGTINAATHLWNTINKPNLMIKIPATPNGIKAFQSLISDGINVNITLLFSLEQVIATWTAYINGLKIRHTNGHSLDHVKAVASFFLSRIDSMVDDKLPNELRGLTAINLSKIAYLKYKDLFYNNAEFELLKNSGARTQQLLWASTGTKNPAYSDVLYVEKLIGNETINTVPEATLNAFRDHGKSRNSLIEDIENSPKIIEQINKYIDLPQIGETLQKDGLKLFETAFDKLMDLVK